MMAELTMPWEEGMESVFEGKREKYTELAAVCSEARSRAIIYQRNSAAEATLGHPPSSSYKSLGLTGSRLRKALKKTGRGGRKRELLALALTLG